MTVRVLNIAKTKYFQQIQCLQNLIYVIVILHRLLVLNISLGKIHFKQKTFFNSSIFPNSPIKHYNITQKLLLASC